MLKTVVIATALVVVTGCGAATKNLLECKLDSLKILPSDPERITIGDLKDVVSRVRACHSEELAPIPPELEE